MDLIYYILILAVAGPIIGSFLGIIRKPTDFVMHLMMAFAAGVMLTISFVDLIPKSIEISSILICCIGITIGTMIIYGVDKLIPHIHPELCSQEQGCKLKRSSIYLLFGIFIHNLPEGMAIAIGTVTDFKATISIAIAIAIHNIPEGICTSAPYYNCTGKRLKSFLLSSSTAIPILIGFFLAKFIFENISTTYIGLIIAATAGLMIYISGDELIPVACAKNGEKFDHAKIFSLVLGVLFVLLIKMI